MSTHSAPPRARRADVLFAVSVLVSVGVLAWVVQQLGQKSVAGPPGKNGQDGKDGQDGRDGADGQTCPDGYSLQPPPDDPDALVCRRTGAPEPSPVPQRQHQTAALDPQRRQWSQERSVPFPGGVQTVTVTSGAGGYRHPDGSVFAGTIRFTPSVSRVISATHGVITLGPLNVTLDASGAFTAGPLLATDATGYSPSGWTYRVDEEPTGAPGRAYSISLPAAVPTVALPSIAPVESSSGTAPAPGVVSVNGETGVVMLSAADVGADATGAAAAARAAAIAAAAVDATTKVGDRSADTTSVHGISDTAALETAAGATAKVTAHTGAADPHGDRAVAAAALAAHEADTTGVHGIANTSALETQAGATSKVSAHTAASDPHGDRADAVTKYVALAGGQV